VCLFAVIYYSATGRPEEIDWFISVLKRSAPDKDAADLARIEAEVRRIAKELLGD
jgi:hypothetical protein